MLGLVLPRSNRAIWLDEKNVFFFKRSLANYVNAVAAAGGYVPYEYAQRKRLASM